MRILLDGIPLGSVSTSMTINAPAAVLLLLYQLVAEEQGVPGHRADRHHPERHPQGVHRPRHVHLSAVAVAPAGRGHLRLLLGRDPAVEHDLDLRLPHGRGRRDAGAGDRVHAGQRHGVRAGRDLPPAWPWTSSRRGSRSSSWPGPRCWRRSPSSARPGGCGPAIMRDEFGAADPAVADAALPHPDGRRAADRAAARGEPGPGHRAGARRGARRYPVAAHELLRRGDRAAEPRRRPGWPCAPSRCWPTRPISPRPWTRSPGRTRSSR